LRFFVEGIRILKYKLEAPVLMLRFFITSPRRDRAVFKWFFVGGLEQKNDLRERGNFAHDMRS
jgi:hypothetical protein